MIQKPLNSISISDIKALIDNSVQESKTLDYKQNLSLENESDKREFLFDVSSFANASGGDIIVGVSQDKETGFPRDIQDISQNMDQLQLQIDSIIRDGISPRLAPLSIVFIPFEEQKHVMLIRISKSWNGPHQVIYKGADRFYSRSNNGKYKLDVFELRNAFLASDSLRQNILRFRNERISNIVANEGATKLLDNGKIVLHIIPFVSLDSSFQIKEWKSVLNERDLLRPFGDQGFQTRYNFDGLLSYAERGKGNYAYLQLFRNGIIESADSWMIQPFNGRKSLYVNTIEEFLLSFMHRARNIYNTISVSPPMIALLVMYGVADYQMAFTGQYFSMTERTVDKDNLTFPDILIEDWNIDMDTLVKPWFDSLWNAVGVEESKSYQNGKWRKLS